MAVEEAPWSRAVPGGLEAYRIDEIPRRRDTPAREPGNRDETDPGRPQRVAALMAAYHAGVAGPWEGTVAFGWVRTGSGRAGACPRRRRRADRKRRAPR